jgi:hypothetical protein
MYVDGQTKTLAMAPLSDRSIIWPDGPFNEQNKLNVLFFYYDVVKI